MNYLYGDSTPSQLTSNFLEFLRSAIDFSVAVLQADERIKSGLKRARELSSEAEAETHRLDAFIQVVAGSIEGAEKGRSESPTAQAGAHLHELVSDTHRGTLKGIRQRLADELAQIDSDEADARESCVKALEALLLPHDPPEASTELAIVLGESGKYGAALSAHAPFGLEWLFDLSIPDGNLWAQPLHVNRVAPQLQIHAPQLSGWISKEVKVKPQKLERHLVTELLDSGGSVQLKLRQEAASGVGYDLTIAPETHAVQATRIGPAEDASVGDFIPAAEDVPPLLELLARLRTAASELPRQALRAASSSNVDFRAQPTFVDFVQRLVAMMAPIVHELSRRSLTRDELILRRLLSDDRREEMFVSKAVLIEKYGLLSPALRELFAPLGLEVASAEPAPSSPPPPVRSQPPPPPIRSQPPPPPLRSQTPPPLARAKAAPVAPLPPPRTPPRKTAALIALPPPPPPPSESASIEVTAVEEILLSDLPPEPSDAAADDPPASESKPSTLFPGGTAGKNQELVATLKKIAALARNGHSEDAHREYERLFSDLSFAMFRPEEQRQALRLMVLPKLKPVASEAVRQAHRAALLRIETLTTTHKDAGDYELLGVAHVTLDDIDAARAAFATALAIERARNAQSELVGTLMRRMSEI